MGIILSSVFRLSSVNFVKNVLTFELLSKKRFTLALLINLLIALNTSISYSQNVIDITKLSPEEDIGYTAGLFKDESRSLGIEEIQNSTFTTNTKKVINLGFSNDNDWIKFVVYNPSNDSLNKVIKISRFLISEIELFYQVNREWKSVLSGAEVPKSKISLRGVSHYLSFTLPANATSNLYLRVTSHNSKMLPISIIDEDQVSRDNNINFTVLGLIIGALLIIALYNLFLGFSIKDSLYVYYAVTNVLVLLAILAEKGGYYFILPEQLNYLAPIFTPLTYGVTMISSAIFSVKFLELKKYASRVYYVLIAVTILMFLNKILFVTMKANGTIIHYQPITYSTMSFSLMMLYSAIIAFKKGSYYAKYYLVGWSAFLLGVALLMLTLNGLMPVNLLTKNFYVLGSICELLIFSFALADRFNVLKRDKEQLKGKLVNTESDLSVVVSDNQLRYQYNTEILSSLENVINVEEKDLKKTLKSFVNDLKLQSEVEEKLNFKQESIQKIDSEFKRKLALKYPELTASEIEIFILMRLNLSTKEIVRIRNSSESAIKSARHRIRKKTNLSSNEIINLTLD